MLFLRQEMLLGAFAHLACIISLISATRWEAQESYILNTINNEDFNMDNFLKSPTSYGNLPPIISMPKKSQRTLELGEIPDYILDYAPLVHLYSEERYLPYDIKKFVRHLHAE